MAMTGQQQYVRQAVLLLQETEEFLRLAAADPLVPQRVRDLMVRRANGIDVFLDGVEDGQ